MDRVILFALLVHASGVAGASAQVSDAYADFQRVLESRRSLRTGHVEWVCVDNTRDGFVSHFTTDFAGESIHEVDRGDEHGIRYYDPATGEPSAVGRQPWHILFHQGTTWTRMGETDDVRYHDDSRCGAFALRTLGLLPGLARLPLEDLVDTFDLSTLKSWTEPDGLRGFQVTAGNRILKIWADPQRGWSPVRTTAEDLVGKPLGEAHFALQQCDGAWFPVAATFYNKVWNTDRPAQTLRIDKLVVNSPDLPQSIGPEVLGVKPESGVDRFVDLTDAGRVFWTGERVLSMNELPRWIAEKEARKQGLTGVELLAEIHRTLPTLLSGLEPTDWEYYVITFVQTYKLDDEQRERAFTILKDCVEQAERYLDTVAPQMDAARRRQREALRRMDKTAAMRGVAEMGQLYEPVSDIFVKRLCPRLESLPTRAQRAAADKAALAELAKRREATTQPAKQPAEQIRSAG